MDYATTLHTWASDITQAAIGQGRCAVAGMGGGILLNDHLQDRSEDRAGRSAMARSAVAWKLGLGTLQDERLVAAHLRSASKDLEQMFVDSTEVYSDRPEWQAIAILSTRTAHAIVPMITRLAGPDIPVGLPYLAPRARR